MPEDIGDDPPCAACKKISRKFSEGYAKTAGSNFGGGNTDWEEKKLKGYAKSETRFIEIMENACQKTEHQCSSFLEKHEDDIEEWYQNHSPESLKDFYQWLCIDTAKVCCPQGTFGKNCRRCQYGDNGRVCSGNGDCDGDGNRSGIGRCFCYAKYSGTNCSECDNGYTKSIDENNQVICTDIDECKSTYLLTPCLLLKCNNTEGSYDCYGKPFFFDITKLSTLVLLMATAGVLAYYDMYGLATITLTVVLVLMVAFAKNLV